MVHEINDVLFVSYQLRMNCPVALTWRLSCRAKQACMRANRSIQSQDGYH